MERLESEFNIKKSFLISAGVHGGLVLFFLIFSHLYTKIFRSHDLEIIKSAVRVDVVGMPKFTLKELRELQKNLPKPVEAAKVEIKKTVNQSIKDTPDQIKKDDLIIQEKASKSDKSKKSFMNLISNYSAKTIQGKKEAVKGNQIGDSSSLGSLIIEGNRLSKGTALVGEYSDEENSEFSNYVQTLPEVIRRFWKLPSYLMDQNLKCRIKIYLSMSGKLVKLEIHESSGQAEFDARAESAIRNASSYFPVPVESISDRVASSGIVLGFPL